MIKSRVRLFSSAEFAAATSATSVSTKEPNERENMESLRKGRRVRCRRSVWRGNWDPRCECGTKVRKAGMLSRGDKRPVELSVS